MLEFHNTAGPQRARHGLLQQFESLRLELSGQDHGARGVASRSGEARDHPELDGILPR
jgi:hypothetical protein